MGDGKALQLGTSHELGQNFARAFDIRYSNEEGELAYGWQTSWGVSTRLIGGLIMVHGDDFGLRLPPLLAPVQVVVMMVRDDDEVRSAAGALAEDLRRAGWRVRLDDRTDVGFGRRSVDWEIKGVPVRLEVGPRDLSQGRATLVLRHRRSKEPVALHEVVEVVRRSLGFGGGGPPPGGARIPGGAFEGRGDACRGRRGRPDRVRAGAVEARRSGGRGGVGPPGPHGSLPAGEGREPVH